MIGFCTILFGMPDKEEEVLVTRRGQTTIPDKIRKKLNIREGTRLKVETKGDKVIFSKIPSVFDLAGTSKLTREQAIRRLDKMREEG
jgi:AbrB family looped-hinge helix DNA binding protein